MKKPSKLLVLWALIVSAMTFHATALHAHSFPETESPAAGQTLAAPPPQVTIKYDAPIEKLFAKLEVIGPDGSNVAADAAVVGEDGRTLSAKLPPLKPGEYLVKWRVVCIDTHHTEGSYQFAVAGPGQ